MKTSNNAIALSLIGVPAHAEIFRMKCFPEAGVPYTVTYNSDARQASNNRRQNRFCPNVSCVRSQGQSVKSHFACGNQGSWPDAHRMPLHLTIPGSTPMSAPP